jgi:hypothetical protein
MRLLVSITEPPQCAQTTFKGPMALMRDLVDSSGILIPFKNTGGINLSLDYRFLFRGYIYPNFIE